MPDLAKDLWDARRLGHTISAERDDLPTTKDEAYALQDAVIALSGLARCGYKVGSTSKEAQQHLNTDEPGASVLLAPYVEASPATIGIVTAQMPAVEGEFAFRMGRDLPCRDAPYTMDDITAAIDGVAGAVEVVGTRFAGGLPGKGRFLTTGDCGVNIGLVVGEWSPYTGQDLRDHGVQVAINGQPKGSGTGSRALNDPLNVMLWLANHLSGRQRGLRAGDIVATGTCTGLDQVTAGDVVTADYGTLGQVRMTFEKAGHS